LKGDSILKGETPCRRIIFKKLSSEQSLRQSKTRSAKIIMQITYNIAGTTGVGTGGPLAMKSQNYTWDRG